MVSNVLAKQPPMQAPAAWFGRFVQHLSDSPVLDLGAGDGRWSERLADAGFTVGALDIDEQKLNLAAARLARFGDRARVTHADVRTADFGEATCQGIILCNVLQVLSGSEAH